MMKHVSLILFLCLSYISISQNNPNKEWNYNTNYDGNGWDYNKLRELNNFIIDSSQVTGFMIVYDGEIIFQYGDITENSYLASCRKSVLSILYGKYVNNGTIDLNSTLEELKIDDVKGLLSQEKKARVKDILASRSGVFLEGSNPGSWTNFYKERGSVNPGEFWIYNNWDFNVAGYIFENETNKNIYDELQEQLAIPLKFQDWDRTLQRKFGDSTISKYPAYHMWFSTRDMARIGLLMLNRGKWDGKQIVSESWIKTITEEHTSNKELVTSVPLFKDAEINFGYGYMWWLWVNNDERRFKGAYSALGAMGQSITIFPSLNTVVVLKTKAEYGRSNPNRIIYKLLKKVAYSYNFH